MPAHAHPTVPASAHGATRLHGGLLSQHIFDYASRHQTAPGHKLRKLDAGLTPGAPWPDPSCTKTGFPCNTNPGLAALPRNQEMSRWICPCRQPYISVILSDLSATTTATVTINPQCLSPWLPTDCGYQAPSATLSTYHIQDHSQLFESVIDESLR